AVTARRLAQMTGQAETNVGTQLKKLIDLGLLERTAILNKEGRGGAYHLNVKKKAKTRRLTKAIDKGAASTKKGNCHGSQPPPAGTRGGAGARSAAPQGGGEARGRCRRGGAHHRGMERPAGLRPAGAVLANDRRCRHRRLSLADRAVPWLWHRQGDRPHHHQ